MAIRTLIHSYNIPVVVPAALISSRAGQSKPMQEHLAHSLAQFLNTGVATHHSDYDGRR